MKDYSYTASRRDVAELDPSQQQERLSISPLCYVKKKFVVVMVSNSDGLSEHMNEIIIIMIALNVVHTIFCA